MGNIEKINIKIHSYYFYNSAISIKKFDLDRLKIDKDSHKNIYYIRYIITKYYDGDVDSVCPFYLIFNEVDWYIEEKKWK